ncbi:hypothetical protein QBC39DRAFT_343166 [Podospora conica]|nr:hypothetical protein QBC39DRAFT_343166 [Schizothecium conicum]
MPADPGTVGSDSGARGAAITGCLFEMSRPAPVHEGRLGVVSDFLGRYELKTNRQLPPRQQKKTSFRRADRDERGMASPLQRFRPGPRSINAKRWRVSHLGTWGFTVRRLRGETHMAMSCVGHGIWPDCRRRSFTVFHLFSMEDFQTDRRGHEGLMRSVLAPSDHQRFAVASCPRFFTNAFIIVNSSIRYAARHSSTLSTQRSPQ